MIISFIAFPIAAVSLAVVGSVLWKHWKEIRLLDPLSLKEEQSRKRREDLIQRRFERIRADQMRPFKKMGRELKRMTSNAYQSAYGRLQAFEAMYRNAKSPFASMAPTERERIKTLLGEARALMRDLKWADAERRYLEVLSMDQHQSDAYRGLGQIYLKQKLYPQAKETFEFIQKIKKADDMTYAALAEIAEAEGDLPKAEAMLLKAVESSPRQAHRHAELASFYLSQNQTAKAWPSAKRAADLEPNSAKYLELSLEVSVLLNDLKEARHRYDRLRLLSEDHTKFQSWRDKIEALEATRPGEKRVRR